MATASTTTTLASSDLDIFYRQIQGDAVAAINFESDEMEMLEDLSVPEGTPWSARSIEIPIDILQVGGIASIPEFGLEARPSSANLRKINPTMIHLNGRFNASKFAMYADKGLTNQVKVQIKQQSLQKGRAMAQDFSDRFYGPSTAYLATTTTAATQSSGAYTLATGYGVATITNAAFIAAKFQVGEWVALIRSSALVTNAIGQITAISTSAPSITVTWNGSVTSVSGDFVVKANSMENTTLAGTDFNRGLTGLIDITTATSLHSFSYNATASTTADPNWQAAYSDASSGRLNFTRIQRAKDEIKDQGGATMNTVILSRGVKRDAVALERSLLRYNDEMGLSLDGDIKAKGLKFFSSKRVPPGYAYMFDRKFLRRWSLLPKPSQDGGGVSWSDGKEYIDQSGFVFGQDWPVGLVCPNRKAFAYWTGLTES